MEHFIQNKLNEYDPIIEQEYKNGLADDTDPSNPHEFFYKKIRELNKQK